MKSVLDRIGLVFRARWQWLTAAPQHVGGLLCGLSVLGAMIAIGYNGRKGIFAPAAPVPQTNDVVAARIAAMTDGLRANNAENSLSKDVIGHAEVVEPSPVNDDFRSEKEGPSAKAIAADKSFLVADTEKPKTAVRDKSKVKKTAKKSPDKTQRSVTPSKVRTTEPRVSSEKDRKFSPSREIKRAGENITRVLRDIF
jgi:hypothetical protein